MAIRLARKVGGRRFFRYLGYLGGAEDRAIDGAFTELGLSPTFVKPARHTKSVLLGIWWATTSSTLAPAPALVALLRNVRHNPALGRTTYAAATEQRHSEIDSRTLRLSVTAITEAGLSIFVEKRASHAACNRSLFAYRSMASMVSDTYKKTSSCVKSRSSHTISTPSDTVNKP